MCSFLRIVLEALHKIRSSIGSLYKASESIATLDMLCSFAEYASIAQCSNPTVYSLHSFVVCPVMTSDTTAIKAGRHPILDRLHPCDVVSNDVSLCQAHSFPPHHWSKYEGKVHVSSSTRLAHHHGTHWHVCTCRRGTDQNE